MAETPRLRRAHLIAGGFPPGSPAGHDHDYARLRILQELQRWEELHTTCAGDFTDLEKWLPNCELLITYTAGPYPADPQVDFLRDWLESGGRWLALHGTSGGRAARVPERRQRQMVRQRFHELLGGFFLTHPPLCRFRVRVVDGGHPVTAGVPEEFETADELYFIELTDPGRTRVLLTTELPKDPSPPGFGFYYERDTALLPDGRSRPLAFAHEGGRGEVVYVALGHCHTPATNVQPFVDRSLDPEGRTPLRFRGSWEVPAFGQLLRNALEWGLGGPPERNGG